MASLATVLRHPLSPVFVSILLAGIGFGASLPILSLLLERQHTPGVLIGLNIAMTALAAIAITPFLPRLLARFGTARLLMLCLVTICVTLVLMRAWVNVWFWFPVRFVFGAALATLFTTSEYWVNAVAPDKSRGRIIGLYAMVFSSGWAIGPLILRVTGYETWLPILLVTGVLMGALIPLGFAMQGTQSPPADAHPKLFDIIRRAPTATLAAFVYGGVEFGVFGLLPNYALRAGLTPATGTAMLAAIGVGNVALQYPLGWLADRIGPRPVLLLCAAAGVLGALTLPLLIDRSLLLYGTLVLWGGAVVGLYTTGLIILGQTFTGAELAAGNAAVVMLYSLGGLLSPPLSGLAMDLWPPHGLPAVLGILCAGYLAVALVRQARENRRPPP